MSLSNVLNDLSKLAVAAASFICLSCCVVCGRHRSQAAVAGLLPGVASKKQCASQYLCLDIAPTPKRNYKSSIVKTKWCRFPPLKLGKGSRLSHLIRTDTGCIPHSYVGRSRYSLPASASRSQASAVDVPEQQRRQNTSYL